MLGREDVLQSRECRRRVQNPASRGGRSSMRSAAASFLSGHLMYRISRNGQEPIVDVDQVGEIEPVVRSSPKTSVIY